MKKLLLFLGVLMGLTVINVPAHALNARDSSNKTFLNVPLLQTAGNGEMVLQGSQNGGGFISSTGSSGVLVSSTGAPITGIAYSNSGTAGVLTIYDASFATPVQNGLSCGITGGTGPCFAEVGPLETVFEATIAANTGGYYDLSNAPINTQNGVVILTSGNTGATIYTSPQINTNH